MEKEPEGIILPELPQSRGQIEQTNHQSQQNLVLASNEAQPKSRCSTKNDASSNRNKIYSGYSNGVRGVTKPQTTDSKLNSKIARNVSEANKEPKTVDIYDPNLTIKEIKGIKQQ